MKELLIDKSKIVHNINIVKSSCEGVKIYGVVKSDAYGLGLLETAKILFDEGIRHFAVTEPSDALTLRKQGFSESEILVIRSTANPDEIQQIISANAIATIGSQEAAVALSGMSERHKTVVEAHIKIDTGFGRYGFLPSETDKIESVYEYMQSIAISGIYTHIASDVSARHAARQMESLQQVIKTLNAKGLETGTAHALSSTALFKFKDLPKLDAVRIGAAVYGRLPGRNNLKRAGVICAEITEVRWLPAKSVISGVGKVRRPTRVGIIPVGYADGYGVENPNVKWHRSFFKLLDKKFSYGNIRTANGEKLKTLGRIGQNHTVIDLTNNDSGVGALVYMDVNPLFVSHMPRKYV